jgi:hypothetical protein
VRGAQREGRFAGWAEVGFQCVPDAGVGLGEVVFEDAWEGVSVGGCLGEVSVCFGERKDAPVRS